MRHGSYVKFDIAVRDYYGSINTAIVFDRLVYWSKKYPEGFYKFKRPCGKTNKLYKKGDSWEEEVGMLRKTLDPIFKQLVQSYPSKRLYLKEVDKFKGKMFASYRNRKTSQTFYMVNVDAIANFIDALNVKGKMFKSNNKIEKDRMAQEKSSFVMSKDQHSTVLDGHSFVQARQQPNTNTQTITSLPGNVPGEVTEVEGEEEKLSSKKMVELWNSHTQDKIRWYPSTAAKLYKILVDFFGGCLETFRKYCAAIGNTPFLMGKATNSRFKAWFYWAIKPEVIKSIFQGAYGVQDILFKIGNISEQNKIKNEINTINYKILDVDLEIQRSKEEIVEAQEKIVREYKQTLNQDVKDEIRQTIQKEIDKKYPLEDYQEKERKILLESKYWNELINYCRNELNFFKPEDILIPQELIEKKKTLKQKHADLCSQLEKILKDNMKERNVIRDIVMN